jgi:hypothetical protein
VIGTIIHTISGFAASFVDRFFTQMLFADLPRKPIHFGGIAAAGGNREERKSI